MIKLLYLLPFVVLVQSLFSGPLRTLEINEGTYIDVKESDKLSLLRRGIKFIDITSFPLFGKGSKPKEVANYEYPEHVSEHELMASIMKQIDKNSMYENLVHFTSFYNRYYKSENGYKSALWLLSKIERLAQGLSSQLVTVEKFEHDGWDQFSIIVTIKGQETPQNIVVLGCHQDSTNLIFPSLLPAPGADDDGSGTVTNMEILRLYLGLISTGYRPKNTIEFHFYSAEEGGMLGSLDLLASYVEKNKTITAMLQQDMTGYVEDPNDEHIGIITDYTTPGLTKFIKLIVNSYLSIPFKESKCGYACSDHSSATKNGYPAAFVMESQMSSNNHYVHTAMDTIDRLSFDHMAEHAKIGLGYILELDDWYFEIKR